MFKTCLVLLLTALVCIVGWYCWTSRDVGRYTYCDNKSTPIVLDGKTGTLYVLVSGKEDADPSIWGEIHPQTGYTVKRSIVLGK